MKSFIQNIKNIWKIGELKSRIIQTIILVAIYRLGSYIVLPGIDTDKLRQLNSGADGGRSILDIINAFTGGAFENASIFALGIMPYISASIIVQLLGIAIPYFQKLQKDGESGRNKLNQYTRYLTVAITAIQAPSYLTQYVPASAHVDSGWWLPMAIIVLTAGTLFVMWLGERITDRGLGNGISLIIMIGIIARLPYGLFAEFTDKMAADGGGLVLFLLEMVILLAIIVVSILLVQGTRRIDIHFAKKVISTKQGAMQQGGNRSFLPIKVNQAGVMPIIFAQALMFVPIIAGSFVSEGSNAFVRTFSDYTSFWYNFVFATLIILFTYFYTAIQFNPTMLADELKRNNGFIQGKKPGRETSEFIDNVISRITLPGSIFLAFVAILPALAAKANVNPSFSQFFGGTSLLILVGVVLDTLAQIDSHLKMKQYDGLMKAGRIKGRSAVSPVPM